VPLGQYEDLTIARAASMTQDPEMQDLLHTLSRRVEALSSEMNAFRLWCDRADGLFLAEEFTKGGADLWPDHPSAKLKGRSHVSINTPALYVEVPSALQAVEPIENMLATDNTPEARDAASAMERVYKAWLDDEDFALKFHKAVTCKSLYGRTAARIYWDKDKKKPCVEIIEQPRNLFLGYKSDRYEEPEWAAYLMRYDPTALSEEYGVEISTADDLEHGISVPWVLNSGMDNVSIRRGMAFGTAKIEVWDYWYREAVFTKGGKFSRMDTYNVVVAGNYVLRGPTVYPEYKGMIPYLPVFNTFIPGIPNGRPDLFDIEPLIREHMERMTSGSQMIADGSRGSAYQLVGPESPTRVDPALKPVPNTLVGPGAGNRIESIQPFIAQYQLDQYITRLDRDKAEVSGMNDLLIGLAPQSVLNSSKAINALIANYETRISIRRRLLYKWRRNLWELALQVWTAKDDTIKAIVAAGSGRLEIIDPSLNPRDELETATRAANLVNAKLWSQRTGMDAVGVDDPETELDLIREESTDATLWPDRVQVMAQLMVILQQLQLTPPPGAQAQAQGQLASGQNDLAASLGAATPQNTTGTQTPPEMGQTPPVMGANAGAAAPQPFAQGPVPQATQYQGMIQGGKAKSRIMTNSKG
jgi:hypothetical protein